MQASPPANEGYLVAAYLVTAVIVLGYAVRLMMQARRAVRDGER